MKLPISPSDFAKKLKNHEKAVSAKVDLWPLSDSVLIEVEESRILLTTTNGIQFVRSRVEYDSSEAFLMCLPYKRLVSLMGQLSEQKLKLEYDVDDFLLKIKAKEGSYEIKGDDPYNFAKFPDSDDKSEWFQCSHVKFKDAVSKTVFACGADSTRPAMQGVYVEVSDIQDEIQMTATDGSILANYVLNDSFQIFGNKAEIIDAQAIEIVAKITTDNDVEVYSDEKNQWFEIGEIEVCCRKIEEKFPQWRNAIPTELKSVKVDSTTLKNSVDRSLLFVNEVSKLVTMSIERKQLEITAENVGFECRAGEFIDLESESPEPISLGLNAAVLSAVLSHTNQEVVTLKYTHPNKAVLWEHSTGFVLQIPVMVNTYGSV